MGREGSVDRTAVLKGEDAGERGAPIAGPEKTGIRGIAAEEQHVIPAKKAESVARGDVFTGAKAMPWEAGRDEEDREGAASAEAPGEKPAVKARDRGSRKLLGRKEKTGGEWSVKGEGERPGGDFLAQGPDEDFSLLEGRKGVGGPRHWLGRKASAEAEKGAEPAGKLGDRRREAGQAVGRGGRAGEGTEVFRSASGRKAAKKAASPARGSKRSGRRAPQGGGEDVPSTDDELLRDVVSTLLVPEGGAAQAQAPSSATAAEKPTRLPAARPAKTVRKKRERAGKEERTERWAFLAQPRSSEYTMIALSWWGAALFVAAVLLGGAVLWAVVNAYLIPRDTEYGALAIVIGVLMGLVFWWKAGMKHGTKLAVQASLVTFFSLFVGEFLHWFLIVVKNKALRTIVFDLISLKFIWENGAEIMKNVVEAMFPTGFLLLLILPTLAAFIIAFGMPPIPEVFAQFWRALRGQNAG